MKLTATVTTVMVLILTKSKAPVEGVMPGIQVSHTDSVVVLYQVQLYVVAVGRALHWSGSKVV
jgi:hypothetical protein